jgi:pyrimidine deaminase RibD-like protein
MIGPCALVTVKCTIVTKDGERIVGTNFCYTPVTKCPRGLEEDYEKCRTVCTQAAHAEVVALIRAGDRAKRAGAYIEGHSRICDSCAMSLKAAGVNHIIIGSPP